MTLIAELRGLAHHRIGPGQIWLVELTPDTTGGRAGPAEYVDKGVMPVSRFCRLHATALLGRDPDQYPNASDLRELCESVWTPALAVLHSEGLAVFDLPGVPAR